MTLALPSYVALKSKYNSKYLRYIHEDVQAHGFLQFSGNEVLSAYSKYEVEKSKNHEGLVHIRSCYNNKYWVRPSINSWWIVAGADEPNEDRISWSCTLFEPVSVNGDDDTQTVRLRHVQLQHYACLFSPEVSPPLDNCLYATSTSPDIKLRDVFLVADLESLFALPKHISFKGIIGKYLSGQTIQEHPYLQFSSSDITDPTVGNEVFTNPDGIVGIKSLIFDRYWRHSSTQDWIWADSSDTENDDTLFLPVRVDKNINNVVALRNLGNNKFCKSLTLDDLSSCLSASAPTITDPEAWLEVEEFVVSRDIYNVNFRLMDARIYDLNVVLLATAQATNETDQATTKTLTFTYQETTSHAWKSSVSLKLDAVKLTLESDIPVISRGRVKISGHFSGPYVWGETISIPNPIECPYTVILPPRTKVTVSKLATRGSCDVPFSYSQRDTLMVGPPSLQEFDDGIFTGVNDYDYKYETEIEPL